MTPTDDEIAVFTAKVANNTHVNLYNKDHLNRVKWIFPLLFLGALILLFTCFYIDLITQMQLIWFSSLLFLGVLTIYLIGKRSCIASLKGETLIFKGIDSKSTITTLGSVRKARTFHVLGIHITLLNFSIDGQLRSLLVFGNPAGMNVPVDELITHAKRSKKK